MFLLSKSAVRWCVSFCIECSRTLFSTLSVPSLSIERSTGPFSQIFSLCLKFGHSCSSPYNPKNNKKAIRYEYLMAILVRFVQTYSVFKQIAKSICNEYSICFSSQNLPYGGASDFVKVCCAHHHNIIKTRNILKNIPRFWYAGRDSNPRPTGS